MSFKKIGILSIGEMGYHWAELLRRSAVEVLTCLDGRSGVTKKRAENAGVKGVSLLELVSDAELIVSVVVPSAARNVAASVARAQKKIERKNLIYLDANAISPMTADAIRKILQPVSIHFVDGSIIGSAASIGEKAVVYVSGPRAEEIRALEHYGLSISNLGSKIGQASAFKIVYAGLTKGLQGLFVELLIGARKFGLLDEILKRYDESFSGLARKVGHSITALPVHAGRRAEEMEELTRTFSHYGLRASMAPAVQKVLEQIAALKAGKASANGARHGDFLATLELLFQKGLMRKNRSSKDKAISPRGVRHG